MGIEGQVEVAVLQHDPSGWPLGRDELVARRRGRSIGVNPHRTLLRFVQRSGRPYRREAVTILSRARVVLVAAPQSRCKEDREHVSDRVGSYEEAEEVVAARSPWGDLLVIS